MAETIPPGRAGRLWLKGRLAYAQRCLELLDRKRQLLLRELVDLDHRRDETRRGWTDSCIEAQRWGLRAAALGGISDVALAADSVHDTACIEIPLRNTMGAAHPGDPRCTFPVLTPAEAAAGNSAIGPAAAAYRMAIEAGSVFAAADRSYRVLAAELHATERRHRAIERRRLPALQDALQRLEFRLDELEREERVVGQWGKRRRESPADHQ